MFNVTGTWIDSEYIAIVENSKSLKIGSELIALYDLPAYLVTQENENEITVDFNFHEGGELQYKSYKNGFFEIYKNSGYDSLKYKENSLILYRKGDIRKYRKIYGDTLVNDETLTKIFSSVIFSRKYICNDSLPLEFNANKMKIGKEEFTFNLSFDYVEFTPLDNLRIYRHGIRLGLYGFAGNGNLLSIYNLKNENYEIGNIKFSCQAVDK